MAIYTINLAQTYKVKIEAATSELAKQAVSNYLSIPPDAQTGNVLVQLPFNKEDGTPLYASLETSVIDIELMENEVYLDEGDEDEDEDEDEN